MTEGGDWDKLGRAAVWSGEVADCIHQNHVFRIRSGDQALLLPRWIVLCANSSFGRDYFQRASKQTTNLASINMTQLRRFPLPLPPIAEQRLILDMVDELAACCDRLEAQLEAGRVAQAALLEATLRDALHEGSRA